MAIAEGQFEVNVKNIPPHISKPYIVARVFDNMFWYYGSYDEERAKAVATELGTNAVVCRVKKDEGK